MNRTTNKTTNKTSNKTSNKTKFVSLHIVTLLIILLGAVVSAVGLLYTTGGEPYDFVNQYGDTVKMYGDGLYAHDSYFMAPIFRGSDFTMLCFVLPLLVAALILDIRRGTVKCRLLLTSVISVFLYYSASLAFGATYNILHLAYIALFSSCLFGLITAMGSIDRMRLPACIGDKLPYRGIHVFLLLTGVALIVAWLPDILSSLAAGRSLTLIEVYTTSITYVLDMGVVGPAALICLFQLRKRTGIGYILLQMLLISCMVIGIMLPVQSIFQFAAGIDLTVPELVTKVASFVVLAFFATCFNVRFMKNLK